MTRTRKGIAFAAAGLAGALLAARAWPEGAAAGQPPSARPEESAPATHGATAPNAPKGREVEGRVERIDRADNVTIAGSESAGLAFQPLKVDTGTEVVKDGKKATLLDVEEGDEVRASMSGNGERVDRIEILRSDESRGGL